MPHYTTERLIKIRVFLYSIIFYRRACRATRSFSVFQPARPAASQRFSAGGFPALHSVFSRCCCGFCSFRFFLPLPCLSIASEGGEILTVFRLIISQPVFDACFSRGPFQILPGLAVILPVIIVSTITVLPGSGFVSAFIRISPTSAVIIALLTGSRTAVPVVTASAPRFGFHRDHHGYHRSVRRGLLPLRPSRLPPRLPPRPPLSPPAAVSAP